MNLAKAVEYGKINLKRIKKDEFPNEEWLKENGFSLLKDCEDVWASSLTERECLDTIWKKDIAGLGSVFAYEEKDTWYVKISSGSYEHFGVGSNVKSVFQETVKSFREDVSSLVKMRNILEKSLS